jgi:multiple sugar transport system permease protein/sn-glycerol 3-phosphate transport system permease protein
VDTTLIPGKARRSPLKWRRNWAYGYLFVFPTVGGFIVFGLGPVIAVFVLSTFSWNLVADPVFVALGNYLKVLSDPRFWNTIRVTATYVLYNIPTQFVLSLVLALALSRQMRGYRALRVIYLVPWVTTPIAVAIVWRWILNPRGGLMNYVLESLGMNAPNWFSSNLALASIAMVNVWQFTGYTTLLLLVGIMSIPGVYYEAAKIDGARTASTFFRITLPLLKPMIMFVLITGIIGSFQVFGTIYAMTEGGPGDATRVLYYAIYQSAFQFLNMGEASAMSVVLFFILMSVTLVQVKSFGMKTAEDS